MAFNAENQSHAIQIAAAMHRVERTIALHERHVKRVNASLEELKEAHEELHKLGAEALAQHCDVLGLDPGPIVSAAGGPKPA